MLASPSPKQNQSLLGPSPKKTRVSAAPHPAVQTLGINPPSTRSVVPVM